jgi:hypothetical protein
VEREECIKVLKEKAGIIHSTNEKEDFASSAENQLEIELQSKNIRVNLPPEKNVLKDKWGLFTRSRS